MKKVTKFQIDRRFWLRGQGGPKSTLLRPADEQMCCLGHYATACGVPNETIKAQLGPSDIFDSLPKQMRWLIVITGNDHTGTLKAKNTHSCAILMNLNDKKPGSPIGQHGETPISHEDPPNNDQEREYLIQKEFAIQGIEAEFIN